MAACPVPKNPDRSTEERERLKAAAGDYASSWVDGQWRVTWWETAQSFPLSWAADVLDGSAEWLRGRVEHPLADAASRGGAEGPLVDIGSGVMANFVTAPLTRPLENAARICEVVGIVFGLATGMHPLVMACAKRLAHDELRRGIARGFEQIICSRDADRGRTRDATRDIGTPNRNGYPGRPRTVRPLREPNTAQRRSRGRPSASTEPVREPNTSRRLDRSRSLGRRDDPNRDRRGDPGRDGYSGRGGR